MIDWNKVIEQSLVNAPLIIGATVAGIYKLRALEKKQDTAIQNQTRIETKVNGNHKQAMRAIKQAGKYEGLKEGSEAAVKALAKVTKRGARRSTDK